MWSSIFQTLSHEPQVLKQGLLHLNDVLNELEPIHRFLDAPGSSILVHELANAQNVSEPMLSAQATPVLHHLASAHAYITMFTHVCKVGQVSAACKVDALICWLIPKYVMSLCCSSIVWSFLGDYLRLPDTLYKSCILIYISWHVATTGFLFNIVHFYVLS